LNDYQMKTDTASMPQALIAALRRRFGTSATINNIAMPTLGGVNITIVFDLVQGSSTRRMVSRQETVDQSDDIFLPSARQFEVLKCVYRLGLRVAEPLFEFDEQDQMGKGYVSAFVSGESEPRAIIGAQLYVDLRPKLAAQCGVFLAQLHALEAIELPFLDTLSDSVDTVAAFRGRYDMFGEKRPAIELGLRWLETHKPSAPVRRLLHGDFRCGNFLVDTKQIQAVLDWECVHLGSPMEDIAWLCTRPWRFSRPDLAVGGFGERRDLYEAYKAVSGRQVNEEEVRYWEIFGLLRWAIYNIWQSWGHTSGKRRAVQYAACGRNTALVEYDLLMTLIGNYK
jgi:aminoglycoside phosphotransferase (APT) family kinase protein